MQLDENISAVITGGASGLGEATARELAKHGVKCALFDLNAEKVKQLLQILTVFFVKLMLLKRIVL